MSKTSKVGYGNPPRANQFQPGTSGNPKGRPRGKVRPKGKVPRNISSDLLEELSETMIVREGNRTKRQTKQRALIKLLYAKAIKGDHRAATEVFKLVTRSGAEASEATSAIYDETDLVILEEFASQTIESLQRRLRS